MGEKMKNRHSIIKVSGTPRFTVSGIMIVMLLIGFAAPLVYSVVEVTVSIADCGSPPGEFVVMPIMIYGGVGVSTADVNISFDASVANIISVDTSDFDTIISVIDNESGWIRIGVFQIMNTGLSGDILLGTVTFLATGFSGDSSVLCFTNVYLEDENGIEISASPINGLFTVEEVIEFFDSYEIHE